MILGVWSSDELETEQVAIGPGLGPDDLGMLDGLVIGCRSNTKRADVPDWDPHVHGDSQAAHARIDRQARAADRTEQVDLGVECPAT